MVHGLWPSVCCQILRHPPAGTAGTALVRAAAPAPPLHHQRGISCGPGRRSARVGRMCGGDVPADRIVLGTPRWSSARSPALGRPVHRASQLPVMNQSSVCPDAPSAVLRALAPGPALSDVSSSYSRTCSWRLGCPTLYPDHVPELAGQQRLVHHGEPSSASSTGRWREKDGVPGDRRIWRSPGRTAAEWASEIAEPQPA